MSTTTQTKEFGMCKETVHRDGGALGGYPCGRPAVDVDGRCGLHRAGKRKRDASAAAWEMKRTAQHEQDCVNAARKAFVATWRAEHAHEMYSSWICPLCNEAIQAHALSIGLALALAIQQHQERHGSDWTAYIQIGSQHANES